MDLQGVVNDDVQLPSPRVQDYTVTRHDDIFEQGQRCGKFMPSGCQSASSLQIVWVLQGSRCNQADTYATLQYQLPEEANMSFKAAN